MSTKLGVQMSSFGERLKEERNRLGLNQTEFGLLGGVLKGAQINYESGKRKPDMDYLEALEKANVDTSYILTGQRIRNVELLKLDATKRAIAVLNMVMEIQDELGIELNKESLQTLIAYAHQHYPTKAALKTFIESAYAIAKDLPTK